MNVAKICLLIFFLSLVNLSQAKINNPLDDFSQLRSLETDESLLMIYVDLNGDTKPDFFLSRKKDVNGQVGNIWMVYMSKNTGFVRLNDLITLTAGSLIIKKTSPNARYRLFSIRSFTKGELLLKELVIADDGIAKRKLARIVLENEKFADTLMTLLQNQGHGIQFFTQGTVKELKKKLDP